MAESISLAGGMHSKAPSKRAALQAIQQGESFIYCLTTRQGAIKFGVSRNVALRIGTSVKFGGTQRLLAFRPGTLEQEQAIHDRLAPFALPFCREYYYPTNEVINVAYEIAAHFDLSRLTSRDFPDIQQIVPVAEAIVAAHRLTCSHP